MPERRSERRRRSGRQREAGQRRSPNVDHGHLACDDGVKRAAGTYGGAAPRARATWIQAAGAGWVPLGAEARIRFDAAPEYLVPAEVSFVSPRAEFTPKQVETQDVRETLSFRVKVRIAPELLARYEALVKTGIPGVAYVRLRPGATWPDDLAPRLPPWPSVPAAPSSD